MINSLNVAHKKFSTKGKEELDQEKNDLEKNIERMVDEDIQAEIEAEAREEASEEEKAEEEKKPAPRKDRIKKPRDTFFDSDSDKEDNFESAYAKPTRGGGQQINRGGARRGGRGGKLQLNEDDFPTL